MNDLLEEYYNAKERMKELEDMINQYKDKIEDEMDESKSEYIETKDYYIERKKMSSETLKKADCPSSVWAECASRHTYTALYIKKKGAVRRRSRSPRRRSRR